MQVEFIDNTMKVIEALSSASYTAAEESVAEIESQTKRNTKVVTGRTKNSWEHITSQTDNSVEAVVGSNYENAIWEEFGTGEYALHGDGRKGGWFYVDAKGNGHFTHGKPAKRAFYHAFTQLKGSIIAYIESIFRGI